MNAEEDVNGRVDVDGTVFTVDAGDATLRADTRGREPHVVLVSSWSTGRS